jgi:hypothetical protein
VARKSALFGSTFLGEIWKVNHTWTTEERKWKPWGRSYNHHVNSSERVLSFLFEKSKNAVRRSYGFFIYPDEVFSKNKKSNSDYERRIGNYFDEALTLYESEIVRGNQQLIFNLHAYYRDYFKVLIKKAECQESLELYCKDLLEIARLNVLNRWLSHVLLELHKSSSSRIPEFSIGLFLLYSKYDLQSDQPLGRNMLKKSALSIFKNLDDLDIFNSICAQFLVNGDLDTAFDKSVSLGLRQTHIQSIEEAIRFPKFD